MWTHPFSITLARIPPYVISFTTSKVCFLLRRFVFRTQASAKRVWHASDWWRNARPVFSSRLPLRTRGGFKVIMALMCVYVSRANFTTRANKILCICTLCTWVFFSKQLSWEFIYVTFVENLNLITDSKCNKILNVITFHLKCNNVWSYIWTFKRDHIRP